MGKSDFELEQENSQQKVQDAKQQLIEQQKELFKIPSHLDVDRIKEDRRLIDHTNWISGLIEVQVSQERKIRNVEASENLRLQQLKKELNMDDPSTQQRPVDAFYAELSQQPKQVKKYGRSQTVFKGAQVKDDLMKMVEREMMFNKQSRQKMRDMEERRESNRAQEEHMQKQIKSPKE
ncbi:hypothetical protein FGO68_gene17768 [Halteria grandinella]|uniref:Uncharacterized protein n=1 Tax=Halteria grandinella TaxID=5974 RepID=A0A8J8T0B1_HALGN|nr:hypothetical protein FGO68_gene17768 [Halteria grandinella]